MMILFLNGKFCTDKTARVSIFDHGFMYGDGVFERLRTYGGKVWNAEAHIQRLFGSAKRMKMHVPWSVKQVEQWMLQTIRKNGFHESNVRIQLTRGMAEKDLRYDFLTPRKPTLCIQVTNLKPWPEDFYTKGISATTYHGQRSYPEVKTTSLIAHVMALHDMAEKGAKEAIFIDYGGFVNEGTSANIFFVKSGKLIVPDARVLAGTTAAFVLTLAKRLKIPVVKRKVKSTEISRMDESFLTSVTRGVMPIASVDGKKFRQKSPGAITQKLMVGFQEAVTKFANASS